VHYLEAWRYTAWFNLLQNPAVSVPVLQDPEGLPIGVQVVARPWEELLALAAARVIEQSRGAWLAPPAPFGSNVYPSIGGAKAAPPQSMASTASGTP
jgi:Asp-tRNA(Asn)/Glu-tRNA(Gln) amidotransferase A subunit family amidase